MKLSFLFGIVEGCVQNISGFEVLGRNPKKSFAARSKFMAFIATNISPASHFYFNNGSIGLWFLKHDIQLPPLSCPYCHWLIYYGFYFFISFGSKNPNIPAYWRVTKRFAGIFSDVN